MESKAAKMRAAVRAESSALKVQGTVAVLFGIAAIVWPGLTIDVLVYLFAAFLLVDGLVLMGMGLLRHKGARRAVLLLLFGLLQFGLGVFFLFARPDLGFDILVFILGAALIVRGLFAFFHTFAGNEAPTVRTLYGALGVLGVVVGIIVLLLPLGASIAFVWSMGTYAIIAGLTMLAMSVDMDKAVAKR
jgi:uncharacterized membrane protein HdeD (DUF308 family)